MYVTVNLNIDFRYAKVIKNIYFIFRQHFNGEDPFHEMYLNTVSIVVYNLLVDLDLNGSNISKTPVFIVK